MVMFSVASVIVSMEVGGTNSPLYRGLAMPSSP